MCCANCFQDHWIDGLIELRSTRSGPCPHCGAADAKLIDAELLTDKFEGLLEVYSVRAGGSSLVTLLNSDWQLFAIPDDRAQTLLRDILGDAADYRYAPRRDTSLGDGPKRWAALKLELEQKNRFFPVNAPDQEQFASAIGYLVSTDVPQDLFRARLFKNERTFELGDLCAPPAEVLTDGRANPIGIPYLYLASDVETAISEVRPSKGSRVAVAKFELTSEAPSFIDLSSPRGTISPFTVSAERIGELRASMDFLCALGAELSRPAAPHRASIDYLASQYLCELVKSIGYDGVIYKSSLTAGRNFAVFDPDRFRPTGEIRNFRVTNTSVAFTEEPNQPGVAV